MNPIETTFSSGATLYAILHKPTTGELWNNVAQAWQAFNEANWASYAVPLAEQGTTGYYYAAYPAAAAGDGSFLTSDVIYQQAGAGPATIDAPATGIGQSQGVDVAAVKSNALAASRLERSLSAMIIGEVTGVGVSTETLIYTTLDDTADNVYQGRLLVFTSGNLIRQVANISAYSAVNHTLTVAGPFTAPPALADSFIIV